MMKPWALDADIDENVFLSTSLEWTLYDVEAHWSTRVMADLDRFDPTANKSQPQFPIALLCDCWWASVGMTEKSAAWSDSLSFDGNHVHSTAEAVENRVSPCLHHIVAVDMRQVHFSSCSPSGTRIGVQSVQIIFYAVFTFFSVCIFRLLCLCPTSQHQNRSGFTPW